MKLHAPQKGNYGRIGRTGFCPVIAASLSTIIVFLAFALVGNEPYLRFIAWLAFPVGLVGVPVGFVLYGVASLKLKCCRAGAIWGSLSSRR